MKAWRDPAGVNGGQHPDHNRNHLCYRCHIKNVVEGWERATSAKEATTMTTMSLARIAATLQRDFHFTANQLRQEGRVVRVKSQSCVDAADTLDRLAATVRDVDPNLLLAYHELVTENPDRVRHAELLRHVAFTGKIKTASEYLSAYISDRTGGGRVA